jgi:catechol 2,3-dioxygenase-like lactoylglutathione lyase family enzyme
MEQADECEKDRGGHQVEAPRRQPAVLRRRPGLEVAMDMGFIVTLVSPGNPTSQINLLRDDEASSILPQVSIEVADVDDVHSRAVARGLHILYPLTNEPWGVRRFFVTDPSGTVINVMCHIASVKSD